MRIVVAQLGARMHYAVPRIFFEAGMLERLFTDCYVGNKPRLEAMLRAAIHALPSLGVARWLGRSDPRLPAELITSFDFFGLRYLWRQWRVRNGDQLAHVFAACGRAFNERIVLQNIGSADTVWGFNGAALEMFAWAKKCGMRCILEQTIVPRKIMRDLLASEIERWPGWEPDLYVPAMNDPLTEREEAEWALADLIVAGSDFVADGLSVCGVPPAKSCVVPYGVDRGRFAPGPEDRPGSSGRLRVLFVGEVGLRKGAPYLLEALRTLGPKRVEARFAGRVALDPTKLVPYRDVATLLGPLPRSRMPELYRWADILVLPSICEGSATVTYEAMASGVPVICTPNTGSIVRDGVDGCIVPVGDGGSLAMALDRYVGQLEDLWSLREAALRRVQDCSHEAYRDCLLAVVRRALA
jgi:glycosyltransferase involved in cell wall biosynthesis